MRSGTLPVLCVSYSVNWIYKNDISAHSDMCQCHNLTNLIGKQDNSRATVSCVKQGGRSGSSNNDSDIALSLTAKACHLEKYTGQQRTGMKSVIVRRETTGDIGMIFEN